MKKTLLCCAVCLCAVTLQAVSDKELIKKLSPQYQRWLGEEVVYIISPVEKETFLQLQSDRERDVFIEAFWKHRDPNPNTPENEVKKEHYERIAYANNWFGKDSPGPGWRTDMGRTHITLGAPRSVEKFENDGQMYPVQIWYYQGLGDLGLPEAFNIVFFKKSGVGEWEYYTPVKYGPQYLIPNYMGSMQDYAAGYDALYEIQPNVAAVSLTLIAGEHTGSSPSLASEILVNTRIPEAAQKKVNTDYAAKFLKFKDVVSVDYSANYIASEGLIQVIQRPDGICFLHYLVEPRILSIEKEGDRLSTNLEVTGNLTDLNGNFVYQFNRSLPITISEKQASSIRNKLMSFQDMLPVIPGQYRLTVLIKNLVSKEFTSLEKTVSVPESGEFAFGPLLLANRKKGAVFGQNGSRPFQFWDTYLIPSPRNDFSLQDTLYLFFQIYGVNKDAHDGDWLEYRLFKNEQPLLTRKKTIGEYSSAPHYFLEEFPLKDLGSANYRIEVRLLTTEDKILLAAENHFYVSPLPNLPRPWVAWPSIAETDEEGYFLQQIGLQYGQVKNPDKARHFLEEAYRRSPRDQNIAGDYARLLLDRKEYSRVKEIILPFVEAKKTELSLLLGRACQALGDFQVALDHYLAYLNYSGPVFSVFNAMAECHLALGDKTEAIQAWERSLQLNPTQPNLRSRMNDLKKEGK